MTKYTKRHYIDIGNLIKKLPKSKRGTEYKKWDKTFKSDNPRYDSQRFKKHIGLK